MSSRTWQMLAAAISVGVMIVVLVKYGLGDDAPGSTSSQPHVGTKHFTEEKPEHAGGQLSPIQVYTSAKVGDWRVYRVTTESSLAPTITATVLTTIREVNDKDVTAAFKGRVDAEPSGPEAGALGSMTRGGEVRSDRDKEHPREGLTIDQLTGNDVGGWTIYDLVVTDEDHTLGGRTFKTKKISYSSNDPLIANKKTHTEMWISTEVPAGGIVEEREVQEMPNMRFVQTQQLVGFGDAAGTTWGEKPEGL